MSKPKIETLFLDIGGVLLTNGWGHELRQKTAEKFGFDYQEFTARHAMIFELFETGRMDFDAYLKWTIFQVKRPFSLEEVKTFIFEAVTPFSEMIAFIKEIKESHGLKVGVVSNEGRELALDRIERFVMRSFIDFFIISSFVKTRKPDPAIYHLAIDIAQTKPEHICYIDDRKLLTEVGKECGLGVIHHTSFSTTKEELLSKLWI